ncbi:MAG: OsmC family protein [Thermoanaerobaculaceae bacterium]|nr:OsmC family protein [Thermoanaerobaculaceae bacterium]MDI9621636.1 OsmC family protein [Acidobacteriota bacterium]NLH09720.1 OsmC family protein [Holophagae bacterium]HPW55991.1 OsmC family protein [Thermoanaerobaculaceae bacterium]
MANARLVWQEGLRFEATAGSGRSVTVDSPKQEGHQGPSPMELVLIGIGGCMAMDVVSIVQKMKQPITGLEVRLHGEQSPNHPKYYTSIELTFVVRGAGVDRERVERAIELSRTTYCSAISSLRPDCAITTLVELTD